MKDNKQIWTTIVVAVIVAIVASVLTVWAMKDNVGLAPTLGKENIALPVRANSCDADGVCETNSVKIGTHTISPVTPSWLEPGNTVLGTDSFIASEAIISERGLFEESISVADPITEPPFFHVEDGILNLTGKLKLGEDSITCNSYNFVSGNGDDTCQSNGYDYCLFAEYDDVKTYYDSMSSCSGNIQMQTTIRSAGLCPTGASSGGGGGCGINQQGVEPYLGGWGSNYSGIPKKVLCSK